MKNFTLVHLSSIAVIKTQRFRLSKFIIGISLLFFTALSYSQNPWVLTDFVDQNVSTSDSELDWEDVWNNNLPPNAISSGIIFDDLNNPDDPIPNSIDKVFTEGSKDDQFISQWTNSNTGPNDKTDIQQAGAFLYDGVLYFFGNLYAANGDANIGFWFFQDKVSADGFTFTGEHMRGDLFIVAAFSNGGKIDNIAAYQWLGDGTGDVPNSSYNLQTLIPANTSSTLITAVVNENDEPTPWAYFTKGVNGATDMPPLTFFEGYIDLRGLSEVGTIELESDFCFSSFMVNTRTSTSVDAALKDFIGDSFDVTPDADLEGATVCLGDQPLLSPDISGGLLKDDWTDFLYKWYRNGVVIPGEEGPTYQVDEEEPGTYTFSVQVFGDAIDGLGLCASEISEATVIIIDSPDLTITKGDITCNGDSDGKIFVPANDYSLKLYMSTSENGNYSVVINPDTDVDGNYINLGAGWYFVEATNSVEQGEGEDPIECSANSNKVEILEPTAVTADDSSTDVSCNGGSDGSVTITFSGGTGPYMVSFDGGDYAVATSPAVFDNLSADTYNWKVKDANDCEKTGSEDVEQPTAVTADDSSTDVSCNGGSDGSVTITFSGGTGPYMISFDGGAYAAATSPAVFDNLSADTYNWKVKDANDCEKTGSEDVEQPTAVMADDSSTDASCNGGSDGSVTITFSGGTGPYMVSFDGGAYAVATSPAVFDNLSADTYNWKVKDANECEKTGSEDVGEPTAVTADDSSTDVSCNGGSDGSVTITFSGGTGPYMISFDGGAYAVATSPAVFDNLSADTYNWKVKDANECEKTGSEDVGEPTAVTADDSSTDVSCNGGSDGSVTITFSGGTGPYMISFDGGAYAAATSPAVFDNLSADTYNWKVKDANDCEKTGSEDVGEPTAVMADDSSTDASCNGGSDGSVTITFSGGTGPYMVSFDGGAYAAATSPAVFDNLSADTYNWKVKDVNGCEKTGSEDVGEASSVVTNDSSTDVSCNGGSDGSVTITFSGGTGPYMVSFDGGDYAVATSPAVFDNLSADTYNWKVKDANGCEKTGSEDVGEPTAVMADDSSTDVSCNGGSDGSVTITFSGGTGPYMVSFDGGAYAAATSPAVFDNLSADTYNWKVKDANECEKTGSEDVGEPTAVMADDSSTDVSCNGGSDGSVTITFSGGTGPYMVSFDGGAYAAATSPAVFDNLSADTYNWKVKDANECEKTGSEDVGEPTAVMADDSSTDVSCNGGSDGSVTITFSGGTGPYMVSFDGGAYAAATSPAVFDNLSADTYNWKVKDVNGCEKTGSEDVGEASSVVTNDSSTDVSCNGGSDGSVTITFSGGTGPYMVSFDGGAYAAATSPALFDNLSADTYNWKVKDANGCEKTGSEDVGEPTAVALTTSSTDVSCNGAGDGTLTIVSSKGDGTPTYSLKINDGAYVEMIEAAIEAATYGPGTYMIKVEYPDGNGQGVCEITSSETISEPDKVLPPNYETTQADCIEGDGSVLFKDFGTSKLYYDLLGDEEGFIEYTGSFPLAFGESSFKVKYGDSDCESEAFLVNITRPQATDFTLHPTIIQPNCETGLGNVVIRVGDNANIDTGFFTYRISSGETVYFNEKQSLNGFNLPPGNYVIFGKSDNGCDTGRVEITLNEPICVTACETAIAKGRDGSSYCFLNEWPTTNTDPLRSNRWGWTNYYPSADGQGSYILDYYAGAGQCSTEKGTLVGNVEVRYDNGKVWVTYNMNDGYVLNSAHVYVGCEPYPRQKKGKTSVYTVAPGQFPFNPSLGGSVKTFTVGPINVDGPFYVIVHGESCTGNAITGNNAISAFENVDYICTNNNPAVNTPLSLAKSVSSTSLVDNGFKISPVPFKDNLTVQYNFDYVSNVSIQVYDMRGQLLRTYKDRGVTKGDTKQLDVDFRMKANQAYIVRLATSKEVFTKNIISAKK